MMTKASASAMMVRVFDKQAFGAGGVEKFDVGRDKRDGRQSGGDLFAVEMRGDRQLNCVQRAQSVSFGEPSRFSKSRRSCVRNEINIRQVNIKLMQCGLRVGNRQRTAALTAHNCRRDFGYQNTIAGSRRTDVSNPNRTNLRDISFGKTAGIEEQKTYWPRSSMMVSESGLPLIGTGSKSQCSIRRNGIFFITPSACNRFNNAVWRSSWVASLSASLSCRSARSTCRFSVGDNFFISSKTSLTFITKAFYHKPLVRRSSTA